MTRSPKPRAPWIDVVSWPALALAVAASPDRWFVGVAAAVALWLLLARRPSGMGLRLVCLLVCLACGVLGLTHGATLVGGEESALKGFERFSAALGEQAEHVASVLERDTGDADDSRMSDDGLDLFERVRTALDASAGPADTAFVVNADGLAVAWSGEGFRHRLPETELPASGPLVLESFTATTLGFVRPLEIEARETFGAFRVVVGRSLSGLEIPRELALEPWLRARRPAADQASSGRLWAPVDAGDHVAIRFRSGAVWQEGTLLPGLLGALLALAGLADGRRKGGWIAALQSVRGQWSATAAILLVALCAATVGGAITTTSGLWAGTLALLVLASLVCQALRREGRLAAGLLVLVAAGLGIGGLSRGWGGVTGIERLGLVSWPTPETFVLLLASGLAVGSGIALISSVGDNRFGDWRWWLGGSALVTGSLLAPAGWPALCALLLGAMLLALLLPSDAATKKWVGAVLLTCLVVACAWTIALEAEAERVALRTLHPTESPFSGPERDALRERVGRFIEETDFESLSLGLVVDESVAPDFPLLLWHASPLAKLSGPSAVRLRMNDRTVFFGPGLEQLGDGTVTLGGDWADDELRDWAIDALVRGRARLARNVGNDLEVEFFALPSPVISGSGNQPVNLARRLLLGDEFGTAARTAGSPVGIGPWSGEEALVFGQARSSLMAQRVSQVSSANRTRAEQWFEESSTLVSLIATRNAAGSRLLRAGVIGSMSLLLLVALVSLAGLQIALARGLGELTLGPFSRRLILAFAILAAVPIALLSWLLLSSFSGRIAEQQRADGLAAVSSAERMVGDYLSSLDPGFSVTGTLDEDLLRWISLIVQHEVNLYWRGLVLTASRPELFASGLLPSQIPGEVYSALDLAGRRSASRVNRTGDGTRYLELYRTIDLPGGGASGLYISVPLLAQELESTNTIEGLRNQALVAAVVLTLLMVALAVRLAQGFTAPLTRMVEGTREIAEGQCSLNLNPRIPELRTLAQSIDEMAGRIAAGRERLLREKRVVDTVVANINSAVVSFGQDRSVMMVNRQAADLLGARPGDQLDEVAARTKSAELGEFITQQPSTAQRTSVRLGDDGEGAEWTVQWLPIEGGGDPAALLVLEDVSEVLRAQRLAAWAEMARIIAHEVKNPLTPIRLSADHLRRVYRSSPERLDEVFDRCVDNILAQVNELRLTAEEFSIYSRIPEPDRRLRDLRDTVAAVIESYASSAGDHLIISSQVPPSRVLVDHDARLIGRVLRNLFENALRALRGRGRIDLCMTLDEPAESGPHGSARIEVSDSGPGVEAGDLHRIFEPSFSASTGGTGLGLPIARSIVEDHGGSITARNLSSTNRSASIGSGPDAELVGLSVSIVLPLADGV